MCRLCNKFEKAKMLVIRSNPLLANDILKMKRFVLDPGQYDIDIRKDGRELKINQHTMIKMSPAKLAKYIETILVDMIRASMNGCNKMQV